MSKGKLVPFIYNKQEKQKENEYRFNNISL